MWDAVKTQYRATWLNTSFTGILFFVTTYFLLWRETGIIDTSQALKEILENAVTVKDIGNLGDDGDDSMVTGEYEGRIVHLVGPLRILEPITEPDYNIQVQAVKLRKRVQMYQWIEETTETEAFVEPSEHTDKIYTYQKDWRDYIIDSSMFHSSLQYKNPTSMPISSESHVADNVKIGSFYLGPVLKAKVNDFYPVWSDVRPDRGDIKLHSGFYYHGESALEHEIGDMRVSFLYAGREDDIYTAVGVVSNGVIRAHQPSVTSDPMCILRKGSFLLDRLATLERRQHALDVWKYRAFGFVQIYIAFTTLHSDWLTLFLRSPWVSPGLRQSSRVWVALVFSASYTLLVVAVPWLLYEPIYGVTMLGFAALPLLYYSTLLTRAPRPPPPPPRHR